MSGETNVVLHHVAAELDDMRCPCGCGQWADEAHDPATEGRWQVATTECFARKALLEHQESKKPFDHALVGVRLARDDDDLAELVFDPARAQAIHDAHYAHLRRSD